MSLLQAKEIELAKAEAIAKVALVPVTFRDSCADIAVLQAKHLELIKLNEAREAEIKLRATIEVEKAKAEVPSIIVFDSDSHRHNR